jgi:hypothetical protein
MIHKDCFNFETMLKRVYGQIAKDTFRLEELTPVTQESFDLIV